MGICLRSVEMIVRDRLFFMNSAFMNFAFKCSEEG